MKRISKELLKSKYGIVLAPGRYDIRYMGDGGVAIYIVKDDTSGCILCAADRDTKKQIIWGNKTLEVIDLIRGSVNPWIEVVGDKIATENK